MSLKETNKRIEDLFNEWKSLQPLEPEYQKKLDKKIRLEWNYNSNRIEGNTLTYGETEVLLVEGKEEGIHPKRDYMEMKAHDLAINKIKEFAKDNQRNLTEADIRDLNQIILKEPFWKKATTPDGEETQKEIIPGKYKTQPNHVETETREIFKFAEPHEVSPKMKDLLEWFNKEMKKPTLTISSFLAELHHRFIVIHPFDDGNGRIARLWVNYVLLRLGYPPLVIKSEEKRNYFAALQKADDSDMDTFAVYLGQILISWLEIGIKAGKGEDIKELSDIDKEIDSFIKEEKSRELKDFSSQRQLSREVVGELCEKFFIPFLKDFEKHFGQFAELFELMKVMNGDSEWEKSVRRRLMNINWNKENYPHLNEFVIFYETYRAKCSKPFDAQIYLSMEMKKFLYTLKIMCFTDRPGSYRETAIKEKAYSQTWSKHEARKFISEGKEIFLSMLKKSVEE